MENSNYFAHKDAVRKKYGTEGKKFEHWLTSEMFAE